VRKWIDRLRGAPVRRTAPETRGDETRDADALYALGVALREAGRIAEAEEHLHAALAKNPAHPAAALDLGRILIDRGLPEDAAAVLSAACRGNPWLTELAEVHAQALLDCGRPIDAGAALDAYEGAEESANFAYLRGLATLRRPPSSASSD
jgi:predicted Zn-dependent protease